MMAAPRTFSIAGTAFALGLLALGWSGNALGQEIPRRGLSSAPPPAIAAPPPPAVPVANVERRLVPSTAIDDIPPSVALPTAGETLTIPMNSARIVTLPGPAGSVVVANETIADVHFDTSNPNQMFVLSRSVGTTAIFVMDSRGNLLHRAMIRVDADSTSIGDALAELLPSEDVRITAFGSTVFLRGKVRSPALAARAVDVVTRLLPEDNTLVNMLEVQGRQQVILQVRVAEMDRSMAKNLRFQTNLKADTIASWADAACGTRWGSRP